MYDMQADSVEVPESVVQKLEASIIFEDEELIVLNKPGGLAVHGGSGLAFGIIEALRQSRDDGRLELVHRLDRETISGHIPAEACIKNLPCSGARAMASR